MEKEKLEELIYELKKIPKNIIDINSIHESNIHTPGCLTVFISLIIHNIPKMQKIYNSLKEYFYSYKDYAIITSIYLGFNDIDDINAWKINNPEIWGIGYQYNLFEDPKAWGQKEMSFSHDIIIKKLESVYKKLK